MNKRSFIKLMAAAGAAVAGVLGLKRKPVEDMPPITGSPGIWYNGSTGMTVAVNAKGEVVRRWTKEEMERESMEALSKMYVTYAHPDGSPWKAV
jgi:hypothetical protein